ncbi:hypothetical protein WT27_01610 [Burkholderia territorii]|uniref:Uncharacterized protein n=1 Tax=Burkholderia territorii TaxID=1503055 RepID=A0A119DN81_9BURK|nr:hypothetical protein WT27_01610 [Burkholderia territorii]KVX38737.1 hypothetical protein WT31_00015 [Burkholderia territorii]
MVFIDRRWAAMAMNIDSGRERHADLRSMWRAAGEARKRIAMSSGRGASPSKRRLALDGA